MAAATKTSSTFMTILKLGMAAGLYVLHINANSSLLSLLLSVSMQPGLSCTSNPKSVVSSHAC